MLIINNLTYYKSLPKIYNGTRTSTQIRLFWAEQDSKKINTASRASQRIIIIHHSGIHSSGFGGYRRPRFRDMPDLASNVVFLAWNSTEISDFA